jgi:hypothetical protein
MKLIAALDILANGTVVLHGVSDVGLPESGVGAPCSLSPTNSTARFTHLGSLVAANRLSFGPQAEQLMRHNSPAGRLVGVEEKTIAKGLGDAGAGQHHVDAAVAVLGSDNWPFH